MFNQNSSPKQAVAPRMLIRGCEASFLAELESRAVDSDLELDLGQVERIDAAGIGALLHLRALADQAGRRLSISSASRRATEVIRLVGLESVFMSHIVKPVAQCEATRFHPAA